MPGGKNRLTLRNTTLRSTKTRRPGDEGHTWFEHAGDVQGIGHSRKQSGTDNHTHTRGKYTPGQEGK